MLFEQAANTVTLTQRVKSSRGKAAAAVSPHTNKKSIMAENFKLLSQHWLVPEQPRSQASHICLFWPLN